MLNGTLLMYSCCKVIAAIANDPLMSEYRGQKAANEMECPFACELSTGGWADDNKRGS